MPVGSEFVFTAEFRCFCCGSIIGIETFTAVVDGVGLEIRCKICRQGYTVTREGAIPITRE
jgi:hypothetical protein